jgi:two-component system response regulator AlgR
VQAVGYLLKPVRRDDLIDVLEFGTRTNAARNSVCTAGRRLAAYSHNASAYAQRIELVPIDDVRFLQADQKYVTLRHGGGELLIDETLHELEMEFGNRFIRVHRIALVATQYIEGLERNEEGHYQIRVQGVPTGIDISRRHVSAVRKYIRKL